MNFVYISPQFPRTYWNFCDRLHKSGVNVLGIGDASFDTLEEELKDALTEYYRVDSMEDYDQVFRAVAYFSFKYGKIDWIESNNEYWLAQDAQLRTDFNIRTGVQADEVSHFRSKSEMKLYFRIANVPTPRQIKVTNLEAANAFVATVGYPVIVKPDIGRGGTDTFKLSNEEEMKQFFVKKPKELYVMEEYVEGDICSYDAIIDSNGEPLFESKTTWPSMQDAVNEQKELYFYVVAGLPEQMKRYGRAACKAFGVKSRFVHLEFCHMKRSKEGVGEEGDYVILEVNMRPAEGYLGDMTNWAHATDVYQIWADMITIDTNVTSSPKGDQFCVFASRRDQFTYAHSHEEILKKYGRGIMMQERVPEFNVHAMGNQMYIAKVPDKAAVVEFVDFVCSHAEA